MHQKFQKYWPNFEVSPKSECEKYKNSRSNFNTLNLDRTGTSNRKLWFKYEKIFHEWRWVLKNMGAFIGKGSEIYTEIKLSKYK